MLKGTSSCGCIRIEKLISANKKRAEEKSEEIIGKQFGDLTPIERLEDRGTYAIYKCRCSCGNEIPVKRADLLNGTRTHCGCKKQEASHYRDITGQRFGKLVALYPTKMNNRRAMMWMFQCDCGNQKEIEGNSVVRGNTLSCGCLKESHGELIISQILAEAKIPFRQEVYMFDFPTGGKAIFDFYVDNKYLIEYDGIQHFESNNRWWNTEEYVAALKERDKIKNQWCKDNNIPLIRIPYTYLSELTLKDLLLETSTFVI